MDPRDVECDARPLLWCLHRHFLVGSLARAWRTMTSVGSLGSVPAGNGTTSARAGSITPSQPLSHSQPIAASSPPPSVHPLSSASIAGPASQSLWSTRLMDLLNLVRHEFDVIGNDAVHFKSQRDELEHRSTLLPLL